MCVNKLSLLVIAGFLFSSCERIAEKASPEERFVLESEGFGELVGQSLDVTVRSVDRKGRSVMRPTGGGSVNGVMTHEDKKRVWYQIISEDRVRVTVLKREGHQGFSWENGRRAHKTLESDLVNVPVIFQREAGEWKGKLEKGEASVSQRVEIAQLSKDFGVGMYDTLHLFDSTPRKVGESWDVDAIFMGDVSAKGEVSVTFVEIQEYEGQDCAVLEGDFDISGEASHDQTYTMKGKFQVFRSLAHRVNLVVNVRGDHRLASKDEKFVLTKIGFVNERAKVISKQD